MFRHDIIRNPSGQMHIENPSLLIAFVSLMVWGCGCLSAGSDIQAQESAVVVTTSSGAAIEGLIRTFDLDSVTIQAGGELKKVGYDQLSSIDCGISETPPLGPIVLIQLMDGSTLKAKTLSIDSRQLKIGLHCGTELTIDSRNVDSVRFKTYENQLELGEQWRKIVADTSREGDAIVINRDQSLDTIEGIVGNLSDDKIGFSIDERTARVPVTRLDAILFYHASGRELGAPLCEVVLVDNSRLLVRQLQGNGSGIRLTCAGGAIAEFPIEQISKFKFSMGQEVFLSSMKPTTNDWQPLITSAAILEKLRKMKLARVNQSYAGRPLRLRFHADSGLSYLSQVKQFENGFAVQGGGKLAFALNGKYDRLTGQVGFDPDANASGNVLLTILLDGKIVFEKELINRLMKNPVELDLGVDGVSRVVFQIEYNDGRSTGDQIHLVDLKVAQ